MSKAGRFLVKHKLSKKEENEFEDFILNHNLKQLKMLSIFVIVLEIFLGSLFLFNILKPESTTMIIVLSFLGIGLVGFVTITLLEKTNFRILKMTVLDILISAMLLLAIYVTHLEIINNRSDILIFFVVIFAYNIMSLNKPIKSIIFTFSSFALLMILVSIYNPNLLTVSIITNTFSAVSLAVLASTVTYNSRLKLFLEIKERKSVHEKLVVMANTDQLTGLNNRRKMDYVITSQATIFTESKIPLSVILLDIDHFKDINDEFGHPLGDEVLIKFSDIITGSLRHEDTAGRWGGEEFIIICRNTTSEEAKMIAERLRSTINSQRFINDIEVKASFGISQMKENMTIIELIALADKALYKAKSNGRDRVEVLDTAM